MVVITNKDKYNAKYKFPKGTAHSKADIVKTTGIPRKILDKIYDRAGVLMPGDSAGSTAS